MKKSFVLGAMLLSVVILSGSVFAHCEIPCGIYDDEARFGLLREHITTMEKSMNQIKELSAASDMNHNQLIRWVVNKEDHANKFQEIVSQYFMTQRIKPVAADADGYDAYQNKVELLHQLLVYAMKCKQTTDQANIDELRELVDDFETAYMAGHEH